LDNLSKDLTLRHGRGFSRSNLNFMWLASSRDKEKVLELARKGQIIESPEDIIKDVFVFEFLKIPKPYIVSENEFKIRLIDNLQTFLLELGKGFTFVGRQYRIVLNNTAYLVDLVFYHWRLIALFCSY
jgi:predicted nuclease of restriction endonuclease-like (RecB) superfamily